MNTTTTIRALCTCPTRWSLTDAKDRSDAADTTGYVHRAKKKKLTLQWKRLVAVEKKEKKLHSSVM